MQQWASVSLNEKEKMVFYFDAVRFHLALALISDVIVSRWLRLGPSSVINADASEMWARPACQQLRSCRQLRHRTHRSPVMCSLMSP